MKKKFQFIGYINGKALQIQIQKYFYFTNMHRL